MKKQCINDISVLFQIRNELLKVDYKYYIAYIFQLETGISIQKLIVCKKKDINGLIKNQKLKKLLNDYTQKYAEDMYIFQTTRTKINTSHHMSREQFYRVYYRVGNKIGIDKLLPSTIAATHFYFNDHLEEIINEIILF